MVEPRVGPKAGPGPAGRRARSRVGPKAGLGPVGRWARLRVGPKAGPGPVGRRARSRVGPKAGRRLARKPVDRMAEPRVGPKAGPGPVGPRARSRGAIGSGSEAVEWLDGPGRSGRQSRGSGSPGTGRVRSSLRQPGGQGSRGAIDSGSGSEVVERLAGPGSRGGSARSTSRLARRCADSRSGRRSLDCGGSPRTAPVRSAPRCALGCRRRLAAPGSEREGAEARERSRRGEGAGRFSWASLGKPRLTTAPGGHLDGRGRVRFGKGKALDRYRGTRRRRSCDPAHSDIRKGGAVHHWFARVPDEGRFPVEGERSAGGEEAVHGRSGGDAGRRCGAATRRPNRRIDPEYNEFREPWPAVVFALGENGGWRRPGTPPGPTLSGAASNPVCSACAASQPPRVGTSYRAWPVRQRDWRSEWHWFERSLSPRPDHRSPLCPRFGVPPSGGPPAGGACELEPCLRRALGPRTWSGTR